MALEILPVESPRDLDAFIRLPFALYKTEKHFIPPLISSERKMLDPTKNPFFANGEMRQFLAKRDGRFVGRIAGIVNRRYEQIHKQKLGFFGYFDCEDDAEAAKALFGKAEEFLRGKGLTRLQGPVNPTTNDPCGTLIDGFDTPPFVLMTMNPSYHDALIRKCGYDKAMDLVAYVLPREDIVRDKVARVAAAIAKRRNVMLRMVDMSRFEEELALIMEIYNDAWSHNWGFLPMTEEEIRFTADDLKAIVQPELVYFVYCEGKPVGFGLGLPDINHSLKKANGSLLPFGWWHFLPFSIRKIRNFRIVALGIKQGYQHLGIGTILYDKYMEVAYRKGTQLAELSWVLEGNDLMNRPIQQMGATAYKKYRLYEKGL